MKPDDPRRALLDASVTTGGVSITGSGESPAAGALGLSPHDGAAASNSWAVDAAHTASGHAVLSNDPHLQHLSPGVFYLRAARDARELQRLGCDGAWRSPGAHRGFGRNVAWGMTTSFVNSQDLMRMKTPAGRDDVYELDGALVPFEHIEQTYIVSKKKTVKDVWRATRFGPVLPEGYPGVRADDPLALSWGNLMPGPQNAHVITGFFDLAAAHDVTEAGHAVEKLRGAGMNVLLAFTDGSVAYRNASLPPLRPAGEWGRMPRDGSTSANAFTGFLPAEEMPKVDAPASGYIVAANQRVVGDADPRTSSVGTTAVPPSRAARIHERIDALLARREKPTVDELLAIQQDTTSFEARELVAKLGALCPDHDSPFCVGVRAFDGDFSIGSTTALPYVLFLDELGTQVVKSFELAGDEALIELVGTSIPVRNAIALDLSSGRAPVLVTTAVAQRAMTRARDRLFDALGNDPAKWRYGRMHTLQFKGKRFAAAPIFGSYFVSPKHEESGDSSTIRAETGLPIQGGACLRMIVEMSSPPVARMTLDTGQSGNPSDPHYMDQYDAWSKGAPPNFPTARVDVEAVTQKRLELLP